jgi:uncharacterized membrane protein
MMLKTLITALGCLFAWLLLMPILLVGGCAVLLYALLSELGSMTTGGDESTLDAATARKIARDICFGDFILH